jgi:hypothetical protein
MMALAVLFVLALAVGWFLGVTGFFRAQSARSELPRDGRIEAMDRRGAGSRR